MIRRFDSMADFGRAFDASKARAYQSGTTWVSNETEQDARKYCAVGNDALVPAAAALLERVACDLDLDRSTWAPSVAGAFPCVPDAILGLPEAMRRRLPEPSDATPVRIFVGIVSSASVSADHLAKRGVAILALTMALAAQRPVELYTVATLGSDNSAGQAVYVTRLATAPLNLSEACYALTSQGFCRGLTYGMAAKIDAFNGHWPRGYSKAEYFPRLHAALGITAHDIFLKPAHEGERRMITAPLDWINETMAAIRARLDNE